MTELEQLIAEQRKDDVYFVNKQFNALSLFPDYESQPRFSRRMVKAPNLVVNRLDFKHGTSAGYQTFKCRCLICKKWRRDYARKERIKAGATPRLDSSFYCKD